MVRRLADCSRQKAILNTVAFLRQWSSASARRRSGRFRVGRRFGGDGKDQLRIVCGVWDCRARQESWWKDASWEAEGILELVERSRSMVVMMP